jgi:hypothetical protein
MTGTVDPRIASARALLAEQHQPITMTHAEIWALLARYQRRVHELLELLDELWISSRAPAAERARRAAELLAEVPQSQRASNPEGDYASVLADLLANIGDDSAAAVRDWLRVARRLALTGPQRDVMAQALADAADYRESGCDRACADCGASPSGLCADHEADMDKADSYRALARALGIEADL